MTVKKEALLNISRPQIQSVSNYQRPQSSNLSMQRDKNQNLQFRPTSVQVKAAEVKAIYSRPQSAPMKNAWRPSNQKPVAVDTKLEVKEVLIGNTQMKVQIKKKADTASSSTSPTKEKTKTNGNVAEMTDSLKKLLQIGTPGGQPTGSSSQATPNVAQQLIDSFKGKGKDRS
jgi:hypothetical protein